MKRRTFISNLTKTLFAIPFLIRRQVAKGNLVVIALIITFTIVMGFIFWKLCQLCIKKLSHTPPPDKDDGTGSIKHPMTPQPDLPRQGISIFDNDKAKDWLWCIDQSVDQHPDPDGLLYKWYVKIQVDISPDEIEWRPSGTLTFYANENTLLAQDHDVNGVLVSSIVTKDWKFKAIAIGEHQLPADKGFYRCTSLIKE